MENFGERESKRKFEEAKIEYDLFREELKVLFDKYNVEFVEHDAYDGEDNYIGCNVYLKLNDYCLYMETLEEIIKDISDKNK
jgi:hypothetical protein